MGKARLIAEEKRRHQEAFEARRKTELNRFKQTLKDALRWQYTTQLRPYVSQVEQKAIEENALTQELHIWLYGVKGKADWLGLQIATADHWLTGTDPDRLLESISTTQESNFAG
jgi:hypothetical protein